MRLKLNTLKRATIVILATILVTITIPFLTEAEEFTDLSKGDKNEMLIPIKQKLNWLNYDRINVNSTFGSWTETRVKQFQRDHDLNDTGVINLETYQKLNEVYDAVFIDRNENHPGIVKMKEGLTQIGFGGMNINEIYGSYTTKRVKDFQSYYGLTVDGKGTLETLTFIDNLVNSPFQEGGKHPDLLDYKRKLNALGYDRIAVNEIYGSWTETRVRQFQRDFGLVVNGMLDPRTKAELDKFLVPGVSSEKLISIKQMLNSLGYDGISVNELYGSWTETRVKQFQQDYGLIVTGLLDPRTQEKLSEVYGTAIIPGESSERLIAVKQMLNWLGYSGINVNESFGSWTETRIRQFQRDNNLRVNGILDQNTENKLEAVFQDVFSQGGENHRSVIKLKEGLTHVGFGGMNINNIYGSYTAKRVQDFQKYYGLTVNGRGTLETLNYLDELVNSPFQEGERHPETINLKEGLNRLGFDRINVNEIYGSWTATRVKQFQSHFGLVENGIADEPTWQKLEEILDSPYQLDRSDPYIIEIKEMLIALGYDGGLSVNENFGSWTEKLVKDFQRDYGLPVSGIFDEISLGVLIEEYNKITTIIKYTNYDITFSDFVDIQTKRSPQTDLYRRDPGYIREDNLSITNSILVNSSNVRIRIDPNSTSAEAIYKTVSEGTVIDEILDDNVTGFEYAGSTKWYRISYDGRDDLYIHSSLVEESRSAVTTANVNIRAGAGTNFHSFGIINSGTTLKLLDNGTRNGDYLWYKVEYNATWRNAKKEDVAKSATINTNTTNGLMQHLILQGYVGATASELNSYLSGRGILDGQGKAFVDAAKEANVNEAYLVAHAILETGHGTSDLSKGVWVDQDGIPVNNQNNPPKDSVQVYNMFGIAAIDSSPLRGGARYAYQQGWTTPEKAIKGGANWIANNYIYAGQDTIYKMRWNPDSPGHHQYATDIDWAIKQTNRIIDIYNLISAHTRSIFDIPQFK